MSDIRLSNYQLSGFELSHSIFVSAYGLRHLKQSKQAQDGKLGHFVIAVAELCPGLGLIVSLCELVAVGMIFGFPEKTKNNVANMQPSVSTHNGVTLQPANTQKVSFTATSILSPEKRKSALVDTPAIEEIPSHNDSTQIAPLPPIMENTSFTATPTELKPTTSSEKRKSVLVDTPAIVLIPPHINPAAMGLINDSTQTALLSSTMENISSTATPTELKTTTSSEKRKSAFVETPEIALIPPHIKPTKTDLIVYIETVLGLNAATEEFLLLSEENYQKKVDMLKKAVAESDLAAEEKGELNKLIYHNERREERMIFRFVKSDELEKINQSYSELPETEILNFIEMGQWQELMNAFGKNLNLSYVFLRAYRERKISDDDLATAMIIHRSYFNDSKNIEIRDIDDFEATLKPEIINDPEFQANMKFWKEIAPSVPPNQRKIIITKFDCNLESQQGFVLANILVDDSHGEERVIFDSEVYHGSNNNLFETFTFGTVAFGLAKAKYAKKNIQLLPVRKMTPTLAYIDRMQQGCSECALFLPSEKIEIHGCIDTTSFSYIHDLIHTNLRSMVAINTFRNHWLPLASKIFKTCRERKLPPFRFKTKTDDIHPYFISQPEPQELLHYLLKRIVTKLADAEGRTIKSAIDNVISEVKFEFQDKKLDFTTPFEQISKDFYEITSH